MTTALELLQNPSDCPIPPDDKLPAFARHIAEIISYDNCAPFWVFINRLPRYDQVCFAAIAFKADSNKFWALHKSIKHLPYEERRKITQSYRLLTVHPDSKAFLASMESWCRYSEEMTQADRDGLNARLEFYGLDSYIRA